MVETDKKIFPIEINMPEPIQFDEQLPAGSELRINNIEDHIKVLVRDGGLCEVFGRELPVNEPVFFHNGEKFAIFCWKDTHIVISGKFESYKSEETPMHIYVNI